MPNDDLALHIDERMGRLLTRFDALIEKVRSIDDKIDRDMDRLERHLDRGFAETQALLRPVIELM